MIQLFLDSLSDEKIRDIFKKITSYLDSRIFLQSDWQFIEITVTTNGTIKYPHALRIRPLDVIVTSQIGTGTYTFNYESFNRETISLTTSGITDQLKIRAFIGSYDGGT